ncbi:MAG TPA: LPXTG cell wall anchor domain-containing protein [Stellaceae bacterium]|nr:LPXTG cell wall anchor domain-containing protein [Stellaceae bacterium]
METLTGHSFLWLPGIAALLLAIGALLLLFRHRRAKRAPARIGPWGGGPWDKFK